MKKCDHCKILHSDNRMFCTECSNKLGPKLSEEEEEKILKSNDEYIDNSISPIDPLHVSVSDKIVGSLSLLGCVASIVYQIIFWRNYDMPPFLLVFTFCYGLNALTAFFPQFFWELSKRKMSYSADNALDANPTNYYIISRRVGIWAALIFIMFMMLFVISIAEKYSYTQKTSTPEYEFKYEIDYEPLMSKVMETWEYDTSQSSTQS